MRELFGLLFVGAFIYMIAAAVWKPILVIVLTIAAAWVTIYLLIAATDHAMSRRIERQERLDAIRARAEQQHNLTMQGDPAGVYGEFPPAV